MKGRCLVTGASGSIGSAVVRALAEEGRPVVMACRNLEKGEAVRQGILSTFPEADIALVRVDLSSLGSVREAAERLAGMGIDAVCNNAGVINRRFSLTSDGLESTFAVNYFGPVLLTELLLPYLPDGAVIVNMVSLTCRFVSVSAASLEPREGDFGQLRTYAESKLALLLYTLWLAEKCPQFAVHLADPGVVNSAMLSMGRWFDPLADVLFRPFCKSPEKGAQALLRVLSRSGAGLADGFDGGFEKNFGVKEGNSFSDGLLGGLGNVEYSLSGGSKKVPARYLSNPYRDPLVARTLQILGLA